jgi:glycosyltransferase involved in cell wall biosynthesis
MNIAAIVIGRNEGDRLRRCLDSVVGVVSRVVYVDSGSSDDSIAVAQLAGAEVVQLDMSLPFTAARARNAGFEQLGTVDCPAYVQFIDGDCELDARWLATGAEFLDAHPKIAVVSGRLRERFPDASVYNMLCDREWNTPVGSARSCGGVAMVRSTAIKQIGGFDAALIAGEEPEMCLRLRANGWGVWRLEDEMALHDAAMTKFSQWWKRSRRGGYAAAQGMEVHGGPPEYHGVGTVLRAGFWAGMVPVICLISAFVSPPWGALTLLIYPAQIARMAVREWKSKHALTSASLVVLRKFAELSGAIEYIFARYRGRPRQIIEYK